MYLSGVILEAPRNVGDYVYSRINRQRESVMSGKSQAIRLPKKFRFDDGCDEVLIRQVGRHLILSPRYDDWENSARTADDFVEAVQNRNASELLSEKRESFD